MSRMVKSVQYFHYRIDEELLNTKLASKKVYVLKNWVPQTLFSNESDINTGLLLAADSLPS